MSPGALTSIRGCAGRNRRDSARPCFSGTEAGCAGRLCSRARYGSLGTPNDFQAVTTGRLRRSPTKPSTPRSSAIAAAPDLASISGATAIEPSKFIVAFPDVVTVITSVIENGSVVTVESLPNVANGELAALSEFNNVSVPNIVFEFEMYVSNVVEVTPLLKFPVNCERKLFNPSGVVRPVADAMIVRVPAVLVLTSVELRSIDSGFVTRLLTSTFVLNVP